MEFVMFLADLIFIKNTFFISKLTNNSSLKNYS